MSLIVPFKQLPHGAGLDLPTARSTGAAGLDLVAAIPQESKIHIKFCERVLVPTGIALQLPSGFEGQVRPRSGLALKHGVTVLNSPGTIDADYRGEIHVLLVNFGRETFVVERGMRIAQLVVAPVTAVTLESVQALDTTLRGTGGFGSTGVTTGE